VNKKAQVGFVLTTFVIVILAGVLLYFFRVPLDDFRVDALNNTPESDILTRLILTGLMPIIWFFYAFLSIFAIAFSVNQSRGVI
jgi:hypothetical protein